MNAFRAVPGRAGLPTSAAPCHWSTSPTPKNAEQALLQQLSRSQEEYRSLFDVHPNPSGSTTPSRSVPRRQRRGGPQLRLHPRGVPRMTIKEIRPPEDVAALWPLSATAGRLAASRTVAPPATRRHAHRRRDQLAGRIASRAARGARGRARRHRAPRLEERLRQAREDGGDRPARGRRRARLQQPADRHLGGYAELLLERRRRRAVRRALDEIRARRRAGGRAHAPAARVQPPPGAAPGRARPQRDRRASMEPMLARLIGEDVALVDAARGRPRAGRGRPRRRSSRSCSTSRSTRATRCRSGGALHDRDRARRPRRAATSRRTASVAPGPARRCSRSPTPGRGMDEDACSAPLRAVLHDQGAGAGHRARPRDGVRRSSSRAAATI